MYYIWYKVNSIKNNINNKNVKKCTNETYRKGDFGL